MRKNIKPYDLLLPCSLSSLIRTSFFLFIFIFIHSCGVEGDTNQDDPIDKFLGTWSVSDQPARINYTVTIVKNPSQSANVLLNNFADMGESANGLVVGNTIVIDNQDIGNDFLCNGTGTSKSANRLEFIFVLDDGIDQENRKAVFTR